jgi:uncharacterized membrane protein YphA (DoxX/SURF4 family)
MDRGRVANREIPTMKTAWRAGLTLLVAALFAYSGWAKLIHPADFAAAVAAYRVTSPSLTAWVAVTLPVFELLLAATLIVPHWRRESAGTALGLLCLFAAAMAQAQARHLKIDCGCFGSDPWRPLRAVPPLLRDAVLIAAAAALRWLECDATPTPSSGADPSSPP